MGKVSCRAGVWDAKTKILSDTATISAGDTEVTVTHNKGVLNYPTATPIDELEGRDSWVEYVDVNSFKIVISMADLVNDHVFYYHV